jgi:hypothetical protein
MSYANRDVWVLQYATALDQVDAALAAAGMSLRQEFPDIADPFVHIESLVIEVPNRNEVLAWKARISPPLEMFESVDLLQFASSDNLVDRSLGLRGLSSILRGFWMGAYKAIRNALADPRLEVRRLALLVTARVAWQDLSFDLDAQAKVEPDAIFRGDLEMLAKELRALPPRPVGQAPW